MLVQQSLQKNQAFFLQGLLFLYKKAVFELTIGILAEKRGISSARMVVSPSEVQAVAKVTSGSSVYRLVRVLLFLDECLFLKVDQQVWSVGVQIIYS